MTIAQLLERLQEIAAHIDPSTVVRVNGEHVHQMSLTLQHPLVIESRSHSEMRQLAHDKMRDQVLDLTINDREAQALPVVERDLRRW